MKYTKEDIKDFIRYCFLDEKEQNSLFDSLEYWDSHQKVIEELKK